MIRIATDALLGAITSHTSLAQAQATFHADAARTGVYRSAGPTQAPTVRWALKTRMPIASSPTVSDGIVYFVSSAGSLAALDAASGEPRWVFVTEHERKFEAKNLHGYPSPAQTIPDAWDVFTSSPAVVNGKVLFGSGDGNL
jgi:hypothetical protein